MTKLTADLRSLVDDGRKWWAVVGEAWLGPWLIEAPSGRSAVASMKRDVFSVETRVNGMSHRDAREWIRIQDVHCESGPYTTAEAFVIDAGWALASRATHASEGTLRLEAASPVVDLNECKLWLTDEQVARILDDVAEWYR